MVFSKFTARLYTMANDPDNEAAIGFNSSGALLELRDTQLLSSQVLPRFFKTGNVASFVRQLHNYGFRTRPLRPNQGIAQCFAHPDFVRGRPDLCVNVVKRKGPPAAQRLPTPPLLHDDSSGSEDASSPPPMPTPPPTYQQLVDAHAALVQRNIALLARVEELERHLLLLPNNNTNLSPLAPSTKQLVVLRPSSFLSLPATATASSAIPSTTTTTATTTAKNQDDDAMDWLCANTTEMTEWLDGMPQFSM